jgi:hypothetical protein
MFGDNYGACLQAFALQKVLEQRNHSPYLIDYQRRKRNGLATLANKIRALGILGVIKYLKGRKYIQKRKASFNRFRNEYLSIDLTRYYRGDELTNLNNSFDIFICGSDMIWSEEFVEDWDLYFLGFAENGKGYAYAPSFGRNVLTEGNKERVIDYLNALKLVSCREDAGVKLINSLIDIDAIQVVDPTLLLSEHQWNVYINDNERIIKEPYTFVYIFGAIDEKRKAFFAAADKNLSRLIFMPKFNKGEQANWPNGIGPIEFLRLMRDAEYIITDTFHGLMFSLIFRKKFVVLQRNDNSKWAIYSDRLTSTLTMFGVECQYIDPDFRDFDLIRHFNYEESEKIIISKIAASLQYIDKICEEATRV